MQEWVEIIKSLGVPVAVMIFMGYGSWKIARWVGEHVISRVVDGAVETLKDGREAVKALREDSERQTTAHVKLVEAHVALVNRLKVEGMTHDS